MVHPHLPCKLIKDKTQPATKKDYTKEKKDKWSVIIICYSNKMVLKVDGNEK